MNVNKQTIRRIRAIASKIFPGDEEYRAWLGRQFAKSSTLELSQEEGDGAVLMLNGMIKSNDLKRYDQHATKHQKQYIESIFEQLGWDNGPRQWGFILKQIGKQKSIAMLTGPEASKIISGLKRMIKDGYPKEQKTV